MVSFILQLSCCSNESHKHFRMLIHYKKANYQILTSENVLKLKKRKDSTNQEFGVCAYCFGVGVLAFEPFLKFL